MRNSSPDGGLETRQGIVAVMVTMLEESELHRIRVSDVARRANVAVPTIYYHFKSLANVIVEAAYVSLVAFVESFEPSMVAMKQALDHEDETGFMAGLEAFLTHSWSLPIAEEVHRLAPLMTHFRESAPDDVRMRQLQAKGLVELATYLEGASTRGWIVLEDSVTTFVVAHWTCVLGQSVFWNPAFGPLTGLRRYGDGVHLKVLTAMNVSLTDMPIR
jgi:AcrR family transcriptional regulator